MYQLLWVYYCQFFILVALYPDISFLTFFGVHSRLAHTLCFIFFCFLVVAYPDISFFAFLGVRNFSYITYCCFVAPLFVQNVPRYFTFAISRGTTLHHTIHTLPPTTHKSILWRCFAPEYAFFSFSFVSNSVPLTEIISRSTTYSIIFFFRFQ